MTGPETKSWSALVALVAGVLAGCVSGPRRLDPTHTGESVTTLLNRQTSLNWPLETNLINAGARPIAQPLEPGYVDGPCSKARFRFPFGLAVDRAGNVYVADSGNNTIRKVNAAGIVTTLAGNTSITNRWGGVEGGYADGPASLARFDRPSGVAVDSAGNLYVADTGNDTIRKVSPAGVVTTLAGNASLSKANLQGRYDDGTGNAARFYSPSGIAVDRAGNVYVADGSNHAIRKVSPAGVVTTLAGNPSITTQFGYPVGGYSDGQDRAARFNGPTGVAVDRSGNVYVADYFNHTIRKVSPAGVVTTLAGSTLIKNVYGVEGGYCDGQAQAARFDCPAGVAVDRRGNVYVADALNYTIRKVSPAGMVTTLAGRAGFSGSADGPATKGACFFIPTGVVVDRAGKVYVADCQNNTIRKVSPTGVVTTLAGRAPR